MKWIKKRKALMLFSIANCISIADHACGTYEYGTIGSYLFGTILQGYTVYAAADIRVQEVSQRTYTTAPQTLYYPNVYNPTCSVAQGNNLTMLAYNISVARCYPIGDSHNYMIDCVATWTVGYNAQLKTSGSLNGNYKNHDAKTPMSGGVDFSFAYDYSAKASSFQTFFCSATGSALAGI